MTRKLAVTVFAISLTLIGCGSSSTTKPDVGTDSKIQTADVAPKLDTVVATDVTKLDVAIPTDVTVKPDVTISPDIGTTSDVAKDTTPAQVEVGKSDAGDAGAADKPDTAGSEVLKTDAADAGKPDASASDISVTSDVPLVVDAADAPAVDAGLTDGSIEAGSDASID